LTEDGVFTTPCPLTSTIHLPLPPPGRRGFVGTGNKNSWLAIIDTGMIVFEVGNRSKKGIIE
jgi:hypothetical protein